jgi:hypothetical protein
MSPLNENRTVPENVRWNSVLSAVLAVILVAELLGLGAYGYYRVQTALQPENLANRVEHAIEENYPEFRKDLIRQVKRRSPQIAEQVSSQIVESAPNVRERLERFTARQLEAGLDEVTELSADKFRQVLQENHDQLVKAFEAVEQAPEETRRLVLETEASLEQQLGVDIQTQARNALAVHRDLNDKLERLADPEATLEPKELIERRIVRIVKTMAEQPGEGSLARAQQEEELNRR